MIDSKISAVVVDEVRVLYGDNHLEERLGPLQFSLNFQSFFQSNPPAFANMLRTVADWLPVRGHLLDLYCGVGTIGLTLALRSGCSLTGVEIVASPFVTVSPHESLCASSYQRPSSPYSIQP